MIRSQLGLYVLGINGPTTKGVGKAWTSLALLEESKEATGQLRALSSSLFKRDAPVGMEEQKQLQALYARLESNLQSPGLALSKNTRQILDSIQADPARHQVDSLFWRLFERSATGSFGVDAKKNYDLFTLRIDQLAIVVHAESKLGTERMMQFHDQAQSSERIAIILSLVTFCLLLTLLYWVSRDLLAGFGFVGKIVKSVAEGDFTEVASHRINDEFARLGGEVLGMKSVLQSLVGDLSAMSDEHNKGEIDARLPVDRYQGEFRSMGEGINAMVDGHIAVKKKAMACIKAFGEGDFEAPLETFPGKKAFINTTIEQMRRNLKALIMDADVLSKAAVEGKLATRADVSRHQGGFRRIVQGVNETLDAVIGPLNVAASYVERISKGDIPAKITDSYNGDFNAIKNNLNTCIEAVNLLVADAAALTRAAVEGRLSTRAEASRHMGDFRKIVQGVNETLDAVIKPVNEAAEVLERVAARDLTARVEGSYQGDHDRIKKALNTAVDNLERALSQVADAAGQVSNASQQIASGSQNLAQGANQQASSLEQVSANLEEMSSMTRQSADNALAAKNLSGEADTNTKQGSDAMVRMSSAINKIKESSDQTAKIVKTIDEIAMQTNLLALNAAVEAARAGEAGRGFAVVAEEVRNLAQRSAQAAKNTADMISESVRNADDGVKIVVDVAGSLDKIAVSTRKVNDLISEIASSAKEQSQGIREVSEAVSQMEKVTQQNAANAEESASASEELSSQSEELAGMVGQFKIGTGSRTNMATMHLGRQANMIV